MRCGLQARMGEQYRPEQSRDLEPDTQRGHSHGQGMGSGSGRLLGWVDTHITYRFMLLCMGTLPTHHPEPVHRARVETLQEVGYGGPAKFSR